MFDALVVSAVGMAFIAFVVLDVTVGVDTLFYRSYHRVIEAYNSMHETCDERSDENESFNCRYCGRFMAKRHDLVQHVVHKHWKPENSRRSGGSDTDNWESSGGSHTTSRGDLIDDYELDRPDDDVDDEPRSTVDDVGGESLKSKKLKKRWSELLKRLRDNGCVEITGNMYVGQVRGHRIIQDFMRDVKRMDLEFDRGDLEVEGSAQGNSTATIRLVE